MREKKIKRNYRFLILRENQIIAIMIAIRNEKNIDDGDGTLIYPTDY